VIGAVRAAAIALALAATARADEGRLRPWTRGETPALRGVDLAGAAIDLRALRGRVVLVEFWASWCEPCEAELPALARVRARLRGRPLEIVTVNFGEGRARVERFLRDHGVDLPVLLDRDRRVAEAWGVGGLPMAFLVDADGRVRASVFGECDLERGEVAAALERLVGDAERAVRAPSPPRSGKEGRVEGVGG
jgi:thiol-disulfide isomerase/thioredoxin